METRYRLIFIFLSALTAAGASQAFEEPSPAQDSGAEAQDRTPNGVLAPKGQQGPGSRQTGGPEQRGSPEEVDQAVSEAVHSFLKGYLSPAALAEAEEHVARRVEENPSEFVSRIQFNSKPESNIPKNKGLKVKLSPSAVCGALKEVVKPQTILFAVKEAPAASQAGGNRAITRLMAELEKLDHNLKFVDPGALARLAEAHPELGRSLGAKKGASDLGLRVLAELVCTGTFRVQPVASHIDGVYVGTASADLRVIDCKTAEVVAVVTVDFKDRIPAGEKEAETRARNAVYRKAASKLVEKLKSRKRTQLQLRCSMGPIYTSLLRGYRHQPFGCISVCNPGKSKEGPFKLTLSLEKNLLSQPFTVEIPGLEGGEVKKVLVRGNLSSSLLSLDKQTVNAAVRLLDASGNSVLELRRGVVVHPPDIFNWERPAAFAAYINPEDPAVKRILRAMWPSVPPGPVPTEELARAASVYGALASLNLRYRKDSALYAFGTNLKTIRDHVNFASETVMEGAGDCDDLTALLSSAFQAAGLRTGLVVGQDHVLVAVETGLPSKKLASQLFGDKGFFFSHGRTWWPVEATALARGGNFLSAWRSGWHASTSLSMQRADSNHQTDFISVREAWKTWKPVLQKQTENQPSVQTERVASSVKNNVHALKSYVGSRLDKRVKALSKDRKTEAEGGSQKERAGLAKLYAACGMAENARRILKEALPEADGFSVHYNLGEVLLLDAKDPKNVPVAKRHLTKALKRIPAGDDPAKADTLLRLALASRLSGEIVEEREFLSQAYAIHPALEEEYEALFSSSAKAGKSRETIRSFLLEKVRWRQKPRK